MEAPPCAGSAIGRSVLRVPRVLGDRFLSFISSCAERAQDPDWDCISYASLFISYKLTADLHRLDFSASSLPNALSGQVCSHLSFDGQDEDACGRG
jgi:hypothetical protein